MPTPPSHLVIYLVGRHMYRDTEPGELEQSVERRCRTSERDTGCGVRARSQYGATVDCVNLV